MHPQRELFEQRVFERGPVVCVFWWSLGDEGKWKMVSLFHEVDRVATATWWWNAGHTVYCNGQKLSLHELPWWAMIKRARVYLWQGRVINIPDLRKEMQELRDVWVALDDKIVIAGNAHVIFDNLQRALDAHIEELKSKKVGTTKKWIWPAYALKALRTSITINILLNNPDRVTEFIDVNNKLFDSIDKDALTKEVAEVKVILEDLISQWYVTIDDTGMMLNRAWKAWERILIEASQSALLALDWWMYPYCTSSDTSSNGIRSWLNLPKVDTTIAVVKAIKSKVWWWYFPTKFTDEEVAKEYRDKWGEYWATTWRPRDVGWFDCVETKRILATNAVDVLCITKADALSSLPEVVFGKSYTVPSTGVEYTDTFPSQEVKYTDLQVNYSKGYILDQDIIGLQDMDELPQSYSEYFNELLKTLEFKWKVVLWTGPKRDEFLLYK